MRRIEDNFTVLIKLLAIGFVSGVFVLMAGAAIGKTLQLKAKDTITIENEIDARLLKLVRPLEEIAKRSKNVNIVISSPGGSIIAGMLFIEAMNRAQERGTKFTCVVDKLAMSMGFAILSVCDKRYIMNTSLLLWHPARVGMMGYATSKMLKVTAKQLDIYNEYLDSIIKPALKISDKVYVYYGDNDMVIPGYHLKKLSPRFGEIIDDFMVTVPREKVKKGKK
jgi:ATP-dependent protease ClpP protease subunit